MCGESTMLTTKNYTVSGSQQKINLNYAAVGQISDQKSHRFLKFGLRLHLSVENLCDNNSSSNSSGSNSPMSLQDHQHHHHSYSSLPAISGGGGGGGGGGGSYPTIMESPRSKQAREENMPVIESFGKYIVKLAEYFRDFEMLHREEDTSSSGNQLSSLRSRIPAKVNELIDSGKDYAKSNPLTFLTIVALVVSCSLPVLVFLAFAVVTVAVTFIGFLFVEGTILTVASVVLTSTLLLVGFFTLTITALLILTYLGLNAGYKLLTGSPLSETNPIKAILHYLTASSNNTYNNGDLVNHADEGSSSEDEIVKDES